MKEVGQAAEYIRKIRTPARVPSANEAHAVRPNSYPYAVKSPSFLKRIPFVSRVFCFALSPLSALRSVVLPPLTFSLAGAATCCSDRSCIAGGGRRVPLLLAFGEE